MKILIDGDACSKIRTIERIAKAKGVPCHIYCDASRYIDSDYSEVHVVDVGANSADMAIIKYCRQSDIVVTNDIGLAAMVLTRGAAVLNNFGLEYTDSNILALLTNRHIRKERQRKTGRDSIHGVPCTRCDHKPFAQTLQSVISKKIMTGDRKDV